MRMYSVALTVDGGPSSYIGRHGSQAAAAVVAMVTIMYYHPEVQQVEVRKVRRGFHLIP